MRNLDIQFDTDKVIISRETYEEIRAFCRMHGETDLPAFRDSTINVTITYPFAPLTEKKLTDE